MEPRSQYYSDPVIVLDFQSLYPSMIIAYNLCFSTIMGKLYSGRSGENDTTGRLGVVEIKETTTAENIFQHYKSYQQQLHNDTNNTSTATVDTHEINTYDVNNQTFISPNGSIFCSKSIRQGILPIMLKDILETRFMIKRAMKRYDNSSDSDILKRVLDARQLSIKLLANVTYG